MNAFEQGNQLQAAGRYEEAIAAFDRCLAQSPQDWQALFNRGNARMGLKRYHEALDDYLQAAALNPASANIKCNLAVLLKELGELPLAQNLLLEVLQAEPDHVDAWSNLGVVMQFLLRYDDAAQCHLEALHRGGETAARCNNLGNAYSCALRLDEAIASYQRGLALRPGDPHLSFNQSVALLLAGRYAEAWPQYEHRWGSILQPQYTRAPWHAQQTGPGTLLLWAEQGLGDTLQMARFIPELQRRYPQLQLKLACQKTFFRLFGQLDGVALLPQGERHDDYDWQLPLMSLPLQLGVTLDNLDDQPYLHADAALSQQWAARLPARQTGRARVGIVWETGTWGVGIADHGRQNKSVPLAQFLPLLDAPGCDFISLQLGEPPAELQGKAVSLPLGDFADTAAVIANLDLVISVDTSVVHLAGALGVPVWVLMRAESAPFFMAAGERSPWYRSMRVFRQQTPAQWEPVLESVAKALREYPL
ncbi:tetratricopeptide repeat-containing glycosyltransferase family protein [uncultured Aquitalea sp.]|uniref:tetratricopeptide repeat-containing glycosyltransferase family protein n=1 Tax=uncultured Aquitalea sp. TaxID=540272 RepID=UPI0025DCB794|nr:tetratricopeptide repeat-containing glycosyltransferase family protein [uncultured Aquitalea sp.]